MNDSSVVISSSLRRRLFLLLVIPLLLISSALTIETYTHSKSVAKASFDQSLKILSLAIMEQPEKFSGDLISDSVINSITDSIGDKFYYYVSMPDNSLISGFSNGPKPDKRFYTMPANKPYLFDALYRGQPTRAVFLRRFVNITHYIGWVELTVWQHFGQQQALHNHLFLRSIFRLISLIALVIFCLWFGVSAGLKPLKKLQYAIQQRSMNDLKPITLAVPSEAGSLVAAMNNLFRRLQQSVEKRESFIANASHQLKTPLANIKGRAELAFQSEDVKDKQLYINDILTMTDQTSRLISQMLSLLKAQSNIFTMDSLQKVEVNSLVKNTCTYYAPYFAKAKRELIFEETSPLMISLHSPIMLTECVSNLIENALNYSYLKKSITVSVEEQNNRIIISVTDSGPGISKEFQDEVTRRFYRVPGTTASGYGLGLAIVKEILMSIDAELVFSGPTENQFTVSIHLPVQLNA